MATEIRFHPGGFLPAAPAQNRAERWTNASQPSDPTPAGYTAWDTSGTVLTQRALNAAESAVLAAQDTVVTEAANAATVASNLASLIPSLQADVTQDNTIITNANTVIASTGTLSSATLSTYVRQLAQGLKTLANNDLNNKRAFANLLRAVTDDYDDLIGT